MEPNNIVVAGALAGAAMGAVGGPAGLLVGAAVGAAGGAAAVVVVEKCFKQPKEEQSPQPTRTEEPSQYNPNPPGSSISKVQKSPIPTPPVITKQFLVLVVSHLQGDFLGSLKAKGRINVNEGEALYEITKYLWLGDESEFSQRKANLNRYLVSEGAESEYDIYLVYIELKKADKGFNSNVNQLDRFDAFRNLANLAVNLTISPRLQMEAYENIGVYNR
jgi:hypothetical protein